MFRLLQRLLLSLMLLCGQGFSVCIDDVGNQYMCNPSWFSVADAEVDSDPCSCPSKETGSQDEDCEEHEVGFELLLTHSVKVPSPSIISITIDDLSWRNGEMSPLIASKESLFPIVRDSLYPASIYDNLMLSGVVMRL